MKLRISILLALLCIIPSLALGQEAAVPSIEATFIEDAPRMDGNLDDAAWQSITPMADFVQRWPVEGAEPT